MGMSDAYLKTQAEHCAATLRYIGLVDERGQEIAGGPYARQPATWTATADGRAELAANLRFRIPGSTTVAGWKGYSDRTSGVDYGGADLPAESFNRAAEYTLLQGTSVNHSAQ